MKTEREKVRMGGRRGGKKERRKEGRDRGKGDGWKEEMMETWEEERKAMWWFE